ncbi:TPA: sugar phosphate isomerase/epimerase [bacterium]|nr:sugar phosphate isomerase/epimerase [bacterium]
MRLGGPLFEKYNNPEEWVQYLKKHNYTAAYCPVDNSASDDLIEAYVDLAKRENIVIAEVGAWSNPLSPDISIRRSAIEFCQKQLYLADRISALCCVNIAGSRGEKWDGPHPLDLTEETFEMIVDTVRTIIDGVNPIHTFYALEPMPWMYPDSADSYLDLIRAIDRKHFAVHLDIVNLINSPERYFNNISFIKETVRKLGPYIKSCHVKDVTMSDTFIVHLSEVQPGLGRLDYRTLLKELDGLPQDVPIMMEHLHSDEEYRNAESYIRSVAKEVGISLEGKTEH